MIAAPVAAGLAIVLAACEPVLAAVEPALAAVAAELAELADKTDDTTDAAADEAAEAPPDERAESAADDAAGMTGVGSVVVLLSEKPWSWAIAKGRTVAKATRRVRVNSIVMMGSENGTSNCDD